MTDVVICHKDDNFREVTEGKMHWCTIGHWVHRPKKKKVKYASRIHGAQQVVFEIIYSQSLLCFIYPRLFIYISRADELSISRRKYFRWYIWMWFGTTRQDIIWIVEIISHQVWSILTGPFLLRCDRRCTSIRAAYWFWYGESHYRIIFWKNWWPNDAKVLCIYKVHILCPY